MPFIHVADSRVDANRFESTHSAHTENDLLANANIVVGLIEGSSDAFIVLVISGHIGVSKYSGTRPTCAFQIRAKTLRPEIDSNQNRLTISFLNRQDRQVVEVVNRIALLLPAFLVEVLAEISC